MDLLDLTSHVKAGRLFLEFPPLRENPVRSALIAGLALSALWLVARAVAWLRRRAVSGRSAAQAIGLPGGAALRRKAKRLARLGDAREAGHLFEILGDLDRAAEHYEKARAFPEAAGVLERARQWARAAALHERAGVLLRAAECHQQGRDFRRAADLFTKAGRDLRAAEALEQGRDYAAAAALYERAGLLEKAAALYERAGAFAAAAEALERHLRLHHETGGGDRAAATGRPAEATAALQKGANLYRLAGQPGRAARLLLHWGAEGEAAHFFLEAGEPRRALDLYRATGKLPEALAIAQLIGSQAEYHAIRAQQLARAGALREAAEAWEQAGEPDRAADIYRELGDWARAGELFGRAGAYDSAAEMFEVAGDWARAGAAYAASRRFADAGRCFRQAGMVAEAANAMVEGGDACGAGALLAEAGRADEAIALLQQVPPESADYGPAGLILGRLLMAGGLAQPARMRLQASVGHAGVAGRTAELHYLLGRASELLDRPEEALEHYERVLSDRVDYEDAGARAAALRLRLATLAVPPDTTVVLAGRPGVPALYKVTGELGRGGMGIVYEAYHQVLRRRVALKVPAPTIQSCPRARERFLSEARIAAGLRHPNIVTIYDAGEANGGLYIAMALIDGTNLDEYLARRGLIAPGELLALARQICAGLAHAHAHSIVHADVKPANMLLDAAGTVHLTDFGLARAWDGTEGSSLEARGTPSYIAPEQVRGEALDARADIYSLGCTLHRMLAGRPPFAKGDVLYGHLHEEPPRLRALNPDIPEALESTVLRCLAKCPADRFPSVAHLLNALEDALSMAPTMPIEEAAAVPALAG